MKVLFATYPMAYHTPGGGEMQLLAYRDHLARLGVQVDLLDMWNPRFLDYDVVHFFSCIAGSGHFCGFVKSLGLPLVVSSSLWITEETRHLYPMEEIRNQLGLANRIVANSDMECDTLAALFALPRERFRTVYNGVDDTFFDAADPAEAEAAFGVQRGNYLLNVGNIEPRKNQLNLVRAARSFPDRKLLLIGHQRDAAYARQMLEEGGSQVIHPGPIAHDAPLLRAAFAGCAAFVLPSTLETPGLAALEAAAQGVPLVVTRDGSCQEYFGDRATYVDHASVPSIAAGISEALARGGAGLREVAERFRWRTCCPELVKVYTELV